MAKVSFLKSNKGCKQIKIKITAIPEKEKKKKENNWVENSQNWQVKPPQISKKSLNCKKIKI